MSDDPNSEAEMYKRLSNLEISARFGEREDLRTTPLLTLAVKVATETTSKNRCGESESNDIAGETKMFNQYAVLGFHAGYHEAISQNEPILMNVDAPNSTFICGSQGSGKSYTLSCMLENCLFADKRIGRVSLPVAGVAFHYDLNSFGLVAETAYLCSMGIRVNVLVSQSNERTLRAAYNKLPNAQTCLTVAPLLLSSQDLSVERMHRLMAFTDKEASMPLYMSVALRVLRQMAIDTGGAQFNYLNFKRALEKENLTKEQLGPLNLRLELFESFLDKSKKSSESVLSLEAGTLTIIDLSDPFMDPATACILFDICLGLIQENRPSCGLVVALDEAHKYMTTSLAAANFTERLLGTIREQRHNGTRVIIATQEPTISEKLLDLCSVSIIHRFTSPAWYTALRNHLGAASRFVSSATEQDAMFERIMALKVGESLLFAPSASLCLTECGVVKKLGKTAITLKTRTRLGNDGGTSVLVSAQDNSDMEVESASDHIAPSSIRLNGKRAAAIAKTVIGGTRTDLSDNELKGTIQTSAPKTRDPGHQRLSTLSRLKSHLALICYVCERVVIIEFPGKFPLDLVKNKQEDINDGIAYGTCVKCQLDLKVETKKESKRFDFVQAAKFYSGMIDINETFCNKLAVSLRLVLGDDVTVLRRDGRPLYIFSRVVQRTLKSMGSVWSAQFSNGHPEIKLKKHEDGVFFKSSLQPE